MRKAYLLVILLVAGLIITAYSYKNGALRDQIPEKFINNSHVEQVFEEKKIINSTKDTTMQKQKFFLVNNMSGGNGGGGSGGGGAGGSSGCGGVAYSQSGDYFVKAKVLQVENVPDGNQMITYTYTVVDEYDKVNQSMPDLTPGNLVVISSLAPPGGSENPSNPFIYVYLEKTSEGFRLLC
ncbi:Uncharacterised protein [uncultured archaeon]|nr:Uncharacterised protein [uncultured archaeon]